MSVACPFARLNVNDAERPKSTDSLKQILGTSEGLPGYEEGQGDTIQDSRLPKCVVDHSARVQMKCDGVHVAECRGHVEEKLPEPSDAEVSPRCPLGYDSGSFKIGPLSCVFCRALLYDSSRCVPCSHIYCRSCISRFQDCLLCGAEIERLEPDVKLQQMVERYIEGHARIKRHSLSPAGNEAELEQRPSQADVQYEDVSLARGGFLIQQAMRALQAQNFESAKSRLTLCADDTREELVRSGEPSANISSQLGAVLGMLGDCCRAMGDADGAVSHYEESVQLLSKLPKNNAEVVHALSVSLNKLGDLKYYAGDLTEAHNLYVRALDLRRGSTDLTKLTSQVLDVAVSLAKVADVSRAMGNEKLSKEGFQEAVKLLENLILSKDIDQLGLEKRRLSVLEFLHGQLMSAK